MTQHRSPTKKMRRHGAIAASRDYFHLGGRLWLCAYCERPLEFGSKLKRIQLTMDHVVPKSRSGPTQAGNLVPCCRRCQEAKADLMPLDWMSHLPDLPERLIAFLAFWRPPWWQRRRPGWYVGA